MSRPQDHDQAKTRRMVALRCVRDVIRILQLLLARLMRLERILEEASFERSPQPKRSPALPVNSVEIDFKFDGSGCVTVDGDAEATFRLPPDLAVLLAVLVEDDGKSDDALVPWKSYRDIGRRFLEKRGKRINSKHVLQNAVYRLRERLKEQKLNPLLVQYNPRRGYRFAVRKRTPDLSPAAKEPEKPGPPFGNQL